MTQFKPIIAANWKMYKTPQEGREFAEELVARALNLQGVEFILAPSPTALYHVHAALDGSAIQLAGQNMHQAAEGAFTGETSARMLQASGCEWVIIGHSERRHVFHESDEDLQKKVSAALDAGLKVIHCIGEQLEQRESGRTRAVVEQQLRNDLAGLDGFPEGKLIIAYEPVWAIGTGVVATPEQAGEAHAEVRQVIGEMFSPEAAEKVKILYGGSVKSANTEQLILTPGIDGFLIGGASLIIDEYCKIAEIAAVKAKERS